MYEKMYVAIISKQKETKELYKKFLNLAEESKKTQDHFEATLHRIHEENGATLETVVTMQEILRKAKSLQKESQVIEQKLMKLNNEISLLEKEVASV